MTAATSAAEPGHRIFAAMVGVDAGRIDQRVEPREACAQCGDLGVVGDVEPAEREPRRQSIFTVDPCRRDRDGLEPTPGALISRI